MELYQELRDATRQWSSPVLVRTYQSDEKGRAAFAREAGILQNKRYHVLGQSEAGSHVHAGRLIMTGGLSILAGRSGIRSKGAMTVTYTLQPLPAPVAPPPLPVAVTPDEPPAAAVDDVMAKLTALADLREKGLITDEEFTTKKTELLARL